ISNNKLKNLEKKGVCFLCGQLGHMKRDCPNRSAKRSQGLGHIKPSVSPWNTPIFTIQKRSSKWRLLHDLRAVNACMEDMGPLQPGFLLLQCAKILAPADH
uniref:CCHC-type domain-containing protein n=1 Tax=Malurus cyaneus samueli TaxID=2593467 RepID=A0A8C5TL94_9PASS